MNDSSLFSRVGIAVGVAVVACATFLGSTWLDGRAALERSDVAFDAGHLGTALREARTAAACNVPFAPHVSLADARLRALAIGAEASGNELFAREAWAALRGAALERQHPLFPEPALEEAEAQLARLLEKAHQAKKERTFSVEELRGELLESRPSVFAPLLGSGAITPLLGMVGLLLFRRYKSGRVDGQG